MTEEDLQAEEAARTKAQLGGDLSGEELTLLRAEQQRIVRDVEAKAREWEKRRRELAQTRSVPCLRCGKTVDVKRAGRCYVCAEIWRIESAIAECGGMNQSADALAAKLLQEYNIQLLGKFDEEEW